MWTTTFTDRSPFRRARQRGSRAPRVILHKDNCCINHDALHGSVPHRPNPRGAASGRGRGRVKPEDAKHLRRLLQIMSTARRPERLAEEERNDETRNHRRHIRTDHCQFTSRLHCFNTCAAGRARKTWCVLQCGGMTHAGHRPRDPARSDRRVRAHGPQHL